MLGSVRVAFQKGTYMNCGHGLASIRIKGVMSCTWTWTWTWLCAARHLLWCVPRCGVPTMEGGSVLVMFAALTVKTASPPPPGRVQPFDQHS